MYIYLHTFVQNKAHIKQSWGIKRAKGLRLFRFHTKRCFKSPKKGFLSACVCDLLFAAAPGSIVQNFRRRKRRKPDFSFRAQRTAASTPSAELYDQFLVCTLGYENANFVICQHSRVPECYSHRCCQPLSKLRLPNTDCRTSLSYIYLSYIVCVEEMLEQVRRFLFE
jgi:hypothetical protein